MKEEIKNHLDSIIKLVQQCEELCENYPLTIKERPDISYSLLKMLYISDELVELFIPEKTVPELLGTSKEDAVKMTLNAAYPLSIYDARGINMSSWYIEKVLLVKNGTKRVFHYWDKKLESISLREDAPMTAEEWVNDGILSGLHQVKVYAEAVREMIEK